MFFPALHLHKLTAAHRIPLELYENRLNSSCLTQQHRGEMYRNDDMPSTSRKLDLYKMSKLQICKQQLHHCPRS
jgi:hypothetical protein